MHFKSFYAANRSIITPRFRASLIWKDLAMIDIKRAWKRLKKDSLKIKYWIHECKGFLAWIFTLIHSSYKHKANPNAQDLNAALEPENTNSLFLKKLQI